MNIHLADARPRRMRSKPPRSWSRRSGMGTCLSTTANMLAAHHMSRGVWSAGRLRGSWWARGTGRQEPLHALDECGAHAALQAHAIDRISSRIEPRACRARRTDTGSCWSAWQGMSWSRLPHLAAF